MDILQVQEIKIALKADADKARMIIAADKIWKVQSEIVDVFVDMDWDTYTATMVDRVKVMDLLTEAAKTMQNIRVGNGNA